MRVVLETQRHDGRPDHDDGLSDLDGNDRGQEKLTPRLAEQLVRLGVQPVRSRSGGRAAGMNWTPLLPRSSNAPRYALMRSSIRFLLRDTVCSTSL